MASILLMLFVLILVTLFVIGFLYYYNAHEAETLTPEQVKEIRENYERKYADCKFVTQNPYSIEPIGISSPVYDIFNNNLDD